VEQKDYPEIGKALPLYLKRTPQSTVLIEGHTDGTAVPQATIKLFLENRAKSHCRCVALGTFEVSEERVSAIGYGLKIAFVLTMTPQNTAKPTAVLFVIISSK